MFLHIRPLPCGLIFWSKVVADKGDGRKQRVAASVKSVTDAKGRTAPATVALVAQVVKVQKRTTCALFLFDCKCFFPEVCVCFVCVKQALECMCGSIAC